MLIKLIEDNKSLKYFITTKKLTRHQACWAKFLSKFNFIINYIADKNNIKANAFTYCPNNSRIYDYNDCE